MLYQETTGTGITIVFIHGISQALSIWDDVITQSSLSNYTLLRIDLPGHGQSFHSDDPDNDYSLKGLGNQVKEHLTNTGIKKYIVVALSMAGNMIAEIIDEMPECVGLVLVGSSVIGSGFNVSEIAQPSPYFGVTFDPYPSDESVGNFLNTWAENMTDELKQQCIKMFNDTDPSFRAQMGKVIAGAEWSDEIGALEKLEYPVAVLYGENEKVIYTRYLNGSAINIWQNEIMMINNAGHCCQLDNPNQFAAIVSRYAADIFTAIGS